MNYRINKGVSLVNLVERVTTGDNNFTTLENEDRNTFTGIFTHRFTIDPATRGVTMTYTIRVIIRDEFDINTWVSIGVKFGKDFL